MSRFMDTMQLAGYFDHTLLKPDARLAEIRNLCQEAIAWGFASVCVPPYYVPEAVSQRRGTEVRVCSVIGFPLGYQDVWVKQSEATWLLENGASELDMVVNLAAVKNQEWSVISDEMSAIQNMARAQGAICKFIIETGLLHEEEILALCELANKVPVDFLKTSTGFLGPGAQVEHIRLMRTHLHSGIRIKASGGIRTLAQAEALIQAGADRIGASSSVSILQEASQRNQL